MYVPILVHFGPVPVSARYITSTGIKWCPYWYWHFCTFVQYQYGYSTLPILALIGASTGNVKEHYAKWHKIYASTSIVPPLLGALQELVFCMNWYPVVLYSSGNGCQIMPVCVLIPIRILACPLPVMGICAFWYYTNIYRYDVWFVLWDLLFLCTKMPDFWADLPHWASNNPTKKYPCWSWVFTSIYKRYT